MSEPKQQPSLNTVSFGNEPISSHQLPVESRSNGDQNSINAQDSIHNVPWPSVSPNQLPITNPSLTSPQVALTNGQTNQNTHDNNTSPRQISLNTEQQALLTERERFQKQLIDAKAESSSLFDKALSFAKQSREKDCELDKALAKQRSDLELFRRSINEMHSSELSSGMQAGINQPGGAGTGDEEIVLKKTDLQKLLYRIDCLKKEAESARHSTRKLETPSSSKSLLKNASQIEGMRQQTSNSTYDNIIQSPQSYRYDPASHQQSKLLQKKLRGLEYLSPKHFIETTQELLHIQFPGKSPSPTRRAQFSFSPSPGNNQSHYNLQILNKQRSQLIASAQSERKYQHPTLQTRSAQRFSPNRYSQASQRSAVSPFEPLNSLPEKQEYSSQESETVSGIERSSPSLPQSSPFSHSPSGLSTRAMTAASPNQTDQKQKQQNEIQEQFNSFGPQMNSPLSQNSRPFSQINSMSPFKAGAADIQPLKFTKLKNRIFLVQKHLFNSPIVQLLGGNRLIVARLFKGQISKEQSSRKLIDGNIFTFEKINMLVSQIAEILRNEVLSIELLRNVSRNIFIIGTRSSQKKAMQAEFVAMLYETFYERVLALTSSQYSCHIKLSFYSTVFETNPSRIIQQPFQKSISIEFNSQEDLPKETNRKLFDFKDFVNQIIQVLQGSRNSNSPNKPRLNQDDLRKSKTKQSKLNICKVRTIKFSFFTLRDNEILSKQSYRMSSTNNITYPEKRNAISIFRSCFFADLVEKQLILVRRQLNANRYLDKVNSILGFKADSVLKDENEFIFSCAPVIKNTDIVRYLFQSADVFEKVSRNTQRQESEKKESYE